MSSSLREEIRQSKDFGSLCEEAFLSVTRTETVLRSSLEHVLAPHGISVAQYNVLRILRGAGKDGLCRNEIRDRLVTRMPDATRLLDRMEKAHLIVRERSTEDRRLVNTTLTDRGREVVESLDEAVASEHQRALGHLGEEQLKTLVSLLSSARLQA
jgi:DNA-binding MarR family transcriptional regulator